MMKKDVRVKINSQMFSLIDADEKGGAEKTEYYTDGYITDTGKTLELSYLESEEMGFDADTYTTLLYDKSFPGRINMSRSGKDTAGLCFDSKSKRQMCALSVGEMSMEFCILTNKVNNLLTENGGFIDLDYVLEFHGCQTQRTILHIEANRKV